MINSHNCECAACNMRRAREAKAFDESHKALRELIESGKLDHLKPKTNEIEDGEA